MRRRWAWVAAALLLAGCAGPGPSVRPQCVVGAPGLMVALFFGRSMPDGGSVTRAAWRQFVDRVVARNLPDGFTVLDASGAWLSPQGDATRHEPTKLLLVWLPERADALAPVQRIRAAYQAQFHQQLVGMTVARACGAF